jgi:hypothetical protein
VKKWIIVDELFDLLFMVPGKSPGGDWRYVMPANWDPYQNINLATGWVEWPQGPLTLGTGETPTWIEAWVVQFVVNGPSSSQSTRQTTGWAPGHWTADEPSWSPGGINGTFQSGMPAVGIGLLASHTSTPTTETDELFWWAEVVVLY